MKKGQKPNFRSLAQHVETVWDQIPLAGMSAARFQSLALGDIPPDGVSAALKYLHNRRTVFIRRNRGEARVYPERPASPSRAGTSRDPSDTFVSSVAPHFRRLGAALSKRDEAKIARDFVAAREARDELDAIAARIVALYAKRQFDEEGFAAARQALWDTFEVRAMEFMTSFEPALALDSDEAPLRPEVRPRRIANGLSAKEKVRALIEKAGESGMNKSELQQAIRPKLAADDLGLILDGLVREKAVEPMQVRVRGSQYATRFFARRGHTAA